MTRFTSYLFGGLKQRWRRQRRRQKVGRAYDMALEIARQLPRGACILDVGCGNGFIAQHLAALLRSKVVGLDVAATTDAAIDYVRYDGSRFPVRAASFDVVLLCYVLHHAADAGLVLAEVSRVLKTGGLAIIYEDMPRAGWDRMVCWSHNRRWEPRTGRCSFRLDYAWHQLFKAGGYEVISQRRLSRWRNLAHPVSRQRFMLRAKQAQAVEPARVVNNAASGSPGEIYVAA